MNKLHFSGLNRMPERAWKAYKSARMCSEGRWKRASAVRALNRFSYSTIESGKAPRRDERGSARERPLGWTAFVTLKSPC